LDFESEFKDLQVRILSVTVAILAVTSLSAIAQKAKLDPGKQAYELQCAICHGIDAKGNGFYTASLKVPAPDLTTLSKRNGRAFPVDRVTKVIDGRTEIAAHGSRDMPIWGRRWGASVAEHYVDVPYDQEVYIRLKIITIIDYLNRVQQQ
jgi:mono/diheme cytochrome c family protein